MRYENEANNVVTVDLEQVGNPDYEVWIFTKIHNGKCFATYYLKRKDVNDLRLIEELEEVEFGYDCRNLLKRMATNHLDNWIENRNYEFMHYINRFEYEQRCFDAGNSYLEDTEGGFNG